MSRTKIVCTIGPACRSPEIIEEMIEAGMNVARLNFSHGTHQEHRENIKRIRAVAEAKGRAVAILQDLSGPKIRVGTFPGEPVRLEDGDAFTLTTRDVPGSQTEVSVNYQDLPSELKAGDVLLLSDGALEFVVTEVDGQDIHCEVIIGGLLSSNKGINLPTATTNIPCLTDKDKVDLAFGLEEGVDYVALSFVRSAQDILHTRQLIRQHGHMTPVIAKIEKHEAVENIVAIVEAADGLMVARGDLGIEIPLEKVPTAQKRVIAMANRASKPVITATQMMGSMVKHPHPTRAEVADVSNAVLDGTDAIMLSEETAVGDYPVRTIEIMKRICNETESHFPYELWRTKYHLEEKDTVPEAISHSACEMATNLNAPVILAFTRKGATARMIARHRPQARVLSVTPLPDAYRQLSLIWGVVPILIGEMQNAEETLEVATQIVRDSGRVKLGQKFIMTGGLPVAGSESTNSITTATLT